MADDEDDVDAMLYGDSEATAESAEGQTANQVMQRLSCRRHLAFCAA